MTSFIIVAAACAALAAAFAKAAADEGKMRLVAAKSRARRGRRSPPAR